MTNYAEPVRIAQTLHRASWILLACSVWLPEIPVWGPIAIDEMVTLVAVVLGVFACLANKRCEFEPLAVLLFGLFVLSCLSNVATQSTDVAIWLRGPGRHLFYVVLLIVLYSNRNLFSSRDALTILCAAAVVEALGGVVMYLLNYQGPYGVGVFSLQHTIDLQTGDDANRFLGERLVASFNLTDGRGMNHLAAYLSLFFWPALAISLQERPIRRLLGLMACGFILIAILLTYTRSILVAWTISVSLVLFASSWRRWAVVAVAGFGMVIVLVPGFLERFTFEQNDRLALVRAALHMASERPWLGFGDGNYLNWLFSRSDYFNTLWGVATTTPHNSVVLNVFRYGIVGGMLSLLVLFLPIYWLLTRSKLSDKWMMGAGLVSFLSFFIQSFSNNLFEVPKVGLFFCLMWIALCQWIEADENSLRNAAVS